jgi:hypothetical protein
MTEVYLGKDNVEPDATAGSSKSSYIHTSRSDTRRDTAAGLDSRGSDTPRDISTAPSPTPRVTASTHKRKRKRKEKKRDLTVEEGCTALYDWVRTVQPVAALALATVLYEPVGERQSQIDESKAFCQILRGCELVSKDEWVSVFGCTVIFATYYASGLAKCS